MSFSMLRRGASHAQPAGSSIHAQPFRNLRRDIPRRAQPHLYDSQSRVLFTRSKLRAPKRRLIPRFIVGAASTILAGGLLYSLYEDDHTQPLNATQSRSEVLAERKKWRRIENRKEKIAAENANKLSELPFGLGKQASSEENSAWGTFTTNFAIFSSLADLQWGTKIAGFILPEWAASFPDKISKLQKEMSMAPGSLADEIWQEAHDTYINPEIEYSAKVRVSADLCDEEKQFLKKRKKATTAALAKYLDIPEEDVHPDDVPTIAMVGSGGGLRALVAGTGSMLAAAEDGLFDCVTYTAGVSGSCWLQCLYNSSITERKLDKLVDHLKARLGTHIAYPPVALAALNSAPTNKFLLSGFVEKLKGDPGADFGIVDLYGLLLAARLLVPKGELGVDDRNLKISSQRDYIKHGQQPMPIYTAVRHEIPVLEESSEGEIEANHPSEKTKAKAKREAWFQWFEITPYEMFCEEFAAGIPTWAIGRKFDKGVDLPHDEDGLRVPELRLSLLLGVFGSAFCATLSHYYREIKPLVKGLAGFGSIDEMIEGRDDDLSRLHPIGPAAIPNFAYGMEGKLPETTPESIYRNPYLQLMDAGMSNNLPIYPLLRPGRDVDILIAFDASADVKTDNWLSVADGYARQRGIKGWPVGAGWPKAGESVEKTTRELEEAQADTAEEAQEKVDHAKEDQMEHLKEVELKGEQAAKSEDPQDSGDLGYCTIWVGTTEERSSGTDDVPSKAVEEDWQIMHANAGIAVIYLPFLKNPKVEGVDPLTSDYMSTWNFVYTPENIDNVMRLAQANFDEGKDQTRRCVRAVYERKKKQREDRESGERSAQFRRKVRLGIVGKKGEGDHFHLT